MSVTVNFTDQSKPGPSGPITAWDLDPGDGSSHLTDAGPWSHDYAADGTYTATLTVTGTGADGTATTSHTVVVTSGTTSGSAFVDITNWDRPSPGTPAAAHAAGWNLVPFNTRAGLDAAISGMAAHDYIYYSGPGSLAGLDFAGGTFYNGTGVLTISSSTTNAYVLKDKHPTGTVVFDFGCSHNIWDASKITGNYVAFRYTGNSSYAAFWINNLSNIWLFGGDYSTGNSGGTGFGGAIGNTHDCYFWDMYSHNNGTGGYGFIPKDGSTGVNSTINHINVRAEAYNWGIDLAADSHVAAPGTGHHAFITADAGGAVTNNTFVIYGHDPTSVGSCFEMGSQLAKGSGLLANNTIYVKAEHFHFHSTQSCSNAVNLWGDKDLRSNKFGWIEGNDLYGAVMHSTGQPNTTGMVVQHGRHSNTNQNPSDSVTVPFPSTYGITYQDND